MCGIAATINGTLEQSENMAHAIRRRGINAHTHTVDNLTVSFVHLPIVEDVMQPCTYNDVTVWLNGFISNWKELCDKYSVIARNDTEYLAWHLSHGKDNSELNGFFAVLYYQDGVKMFTDRYGIKQLYTYHVGETTFICSEVKGLKAVANLKVNFDAMEDWEHSLGVMTHDTIYNGVNRVDCLEFVKPKKIEVGYNLAKETLQELLNKSLVRNIYFDSGVYLSGGVDSGLIAQRLGKYSFSVDYLDGKSEIENIKLNSKGKHYTFIANNSVHTTFHYPHDTLKALDDLKVGSCYTNFAIAELASKFCKVMYSGAGGIT